MFVLCLLLWMILSGKFTLEILGFGILVSAGVTAAVRRMTGLTRRQEWRAAGKLPAALGYGWLLLREIIRANLTVIPMVYRRNKPEPCYKTFTAPLRTTAARVTLADSITLTPGTITAEQDGAGMTVHCLDRTLAEGLEDSRFVRRLQSMEKQEEFHEV